LAGFEVEVVKVARTARPGIAAAEDLPGLLPRADVVILAVPLTCQTRTLMDAQFLGRMERRALLVNVAHIEVVDTEALLCETASDRIRAAPAMTEPEPLPPAASPVERAECCDHAACRRGVHGGAAARRAPDPRSAVLLRDRQSNGQHHHRRVLSADAKGFG